MTRTSAELEGTSRAKARMARTMATGTPGRGRSRGPSVDEAPRLRPRRRPNPWLRRALVFATCVLLTDALFGDRGLAESRRVQDEYTTALTDLQRLKKENAGLREQIRRLQHDPAAIEDLARKHLGLIRPGEVLVVVRDVKEGR